MIIGIDVGGSKLRIGLLDKDKGLITKHVVSTPPLWVGGLELIDTAIKEFFKDPALKPTAIVLGYRGEPLTDGSFRGMSAQLADWQGKPVKTELEKRYGVPVTLLNDAALGALGEAHFGAGKGLEIVAYLTISTGIGGARVVRGKLDVNRWGFEPGHHYIHDLSQEGLCGQRGCFENVAAASTFMRVHGLKVSESTDRQALEDYGKVVARGIANIAYLWSPDVIIIGGGASEGWDKLHLVVDREMALHMRRFAPGLPVKPAALGGDAGLWGALAVDISSIAQPASITKVTMHKLE